MNSANHSDSTTTTTIPRASTTTQMSVTYQNIAQKNTKRETWNGFKYKFTVFKNCDKMSHLTS